MTAGQLSRESWWPSPSLDKSERRLHAGVGSCGPHRNEARSPVLVGVAGVANQIIVRVGLEGDVLSPHLQKCLQEAEMICHLIGVWDVRTAVACVSHFVSIPILLVNVGDSFAVIQVVEDS